MSVLRVWATARPRSLAVTAAGGVTGVALLAAVSFGAGPGASEPEPLRPPTPTPSLTPDVNGWPDTLGNPRGVYSLDGNRCGLNGDGRRSSCNYGYMHNAGGSNDVSIVINVGADKVSLDDGGTSVSIAGHEGTHRQITPRLEDWTADIDGTPVAITLTAAPGTSQTDLAEAHAIIDSLRTGPALASGNDFGFSLVFTLTTSDWDSG
jgi:hypothetical protein